MIRSNMICCLLINILQLLRNNAATIYQYNVIPYDDHSIDGDTHSLQYYVNNTSKYFTTSHTQLHFLPGEHYLLSDFTVQNITDFTLDGRNNSIITCRNLSVGIMFTNVTNLILKNIKILECGKYDYRVFVNASSEEYEDIRPVWSSPIYINFCNVTISNVSINIRANMSGIIAINVYSYMVNVYSSMVNVHIYAECHNSSLPVNGILFYYSDYAGKMKKYKTTISHYIYTTNGWCNNSYALTYLMMQLKYPVGTKIQKSNFTNLQRSSILYYYGKSCGGDFNTTVEFYNCTISYNKGASHVKLFHIIVYSQGYIFGGIKGRNHCEKQTNIIKLSNCMITKNSNMHSLIYAILKNTLAFNLYINFKSCTFTLNDRVGFIHTQSELKSLWQSSHYITMQGTTIASNILSDKASLISSTNGLLKFSQDMIIKNNTGKSIVHLRLSVLKFKGYIEFTFNQVRSILKSRGGSYYLLKGITTVNISHNFVYSVLDIHPPYDDNLNKICCFQFISNENDEEEVHVNNYHILMINNTYTAPEYSLINMSSMNCAWLKGTAFSTVETIESTRVLSTIVKTKRISANKSNIGTINSSICLCQNSCTINNCSEHKLGSIFPGQTLQVNLVLNRLKTPEHVSNALIAKTKELPPHACTIVNVAEITQERESDGCNQYNYTIWSDKSECELYLGTEDVPEIFYVDLKACPPGFSLQHDRKGCSCDPNLNTRYVSISSCNLDDATILRPANSWMSVERINDSYTYYVSPHCPFDYCLPYSSHHNLSDPDSQCQFYRSGELCGQCRQGLSAVFGSSQCKQCTHYYLFIIIPIAAAGFLLVVVIFIFNFTVTDGTINIFILYANIISINFSLFCPNRYYVNCCTLFSLMNLDLGFEVCFYNGMDNYAKMWLQLAFPCYLLSIAVALIIGSRYSTKIQRLTAHRALQVLATLILLSYTKILLTVCQVLFLFTPIIHLPSKHTRLAWSIDASVLMTTTKFVALYIVCSILFLMMLFFNLFLLFPRMLLRFKLVNTFKPLLDAFIGPYKDKFSFWTGIQLLLRAVIFSTSTLDYKISLTCGAVVLGAVLCLQGVMQPFKSKLINIQESLILFNLLTVYSISVLNSIKVFYIMKSLINIILLCFIIFVVYRCIAITCGDSIIRKCQPVIRCLKKRKLHTTPISLNINIPDVTYNYQEFQEPLIEFDNY